MFKELDFFKPVSSCLHISSGNGNEPLERPLAGTVAGAGFLLSHSLHTPSPHKDCHPSVKTEAQHAAKTKVTLLASSPLRVKSALRLSTKPTVPAPASAPTLTCEAQPQRRRLPSTAARAGHTARPPRLWPSRALRSPAVCHFPSP